MATFTSPTKKVSLDPDMEKVLRSSVTTTKPVTKSSGAAPPINEKGGPPTGGYLKMPFSTNPQDLNASIIGGMMSSGTLSEDQVKANAQNSGINLTSMMAPAPKTTPETTPLPSSTGTATQATGAAQATPVNMEDVRNRAQNDANLQIQLQRDAAMRNFSRFESEGAAQVDKLRAMYAPQYRQNELNTTVAARNAVQGAANRGFFASGLSADADMRAQLAGEQQRMALQGQENAQIGEIENRINQARLELGDNLESLAGREGQLTQSLIDAYSRDERGFDLQNRQLLSDTMLRLLGMDQSSSQFSQSLEWDKNRYGMQMGENAAQRQWQSNENAIHRNWTGQQNTDNRNWQAEQSALDRQNRVELANLDTQTRTQLQQMEQAWRSGQASLDRADSRQRWEIETGLQVKWREQQMELDQAQFALRQNESMYDRETRIKAANSQWMAFADQAIQAGAWKSYDDAVKALDSFSTRIITDGADMIGLHTYIKNRLGQSSPQGMIPPGQPGNSNKTYPYFPNTTIGPAN